MRASCLAISLLLFALSTGQAGAAAPTIESAAPAWSLLKSLTGKVVLVDFWASWCGPCLQSFPWMNDLQQKHADEGLVVVAVNLDQEPALAEAFLKKLPAKFRIEYDQSGNIARQFDVQAMPTSFLIDRSGRVRARHAGFKDKYREERERQIQNLLKESPP
ncbi:MAG TPA: TlpA disulfide reductase family protein [Steroidobacteraceae bacterium]